MVQHLLDTIATQKTIIESLREQNETLRRRVDNLERQQAAAAKRATTPKKRGGKRANYEFVRALFDEELLDDALLRRMYDHAGGDICRTTDAVLQWLESPWIDESGAVQNLSADLEQLFKAEDSATANTDDLTMADRIKLDK